MAKFLHDDQKILWRLNRNSHSIYLRMNYHRVILAALGVLLSMGSFFSQNLCSENEIEETMLFFLHREAIADRYGPGSNDFLQLKEILKPYLSHLTSGDKYAPSTWNFEGNMFKSFVLFDNFLHRNNNAGSNFNHYELPSQRKYEEYLADVFGLQQREINYYHEYIDSSTSNYFSDRLPYALENNNLAQSQTWGPNFGQGTGTDSLSSSAIIGEYAFNGIVQKRIAIPVNAAVYKLKFHAKGWWNNFNTHCDQCVVFAIQAYDVDYNKLFLGDSDAMVPPGQTKNNTNPTWSDLINMYQRAKGLNDAHYETVTDDPEDVDNNPTVIWKDKSVNEVYLSSDVKYVDIYIYTPYNGGQMGNWLVGNTPVAAIDDIYFGIGNNGTNLIKDSGFKLNVQEGDAEYGAWEQCKFERDLGTYIDRTGLLTAMDSAYTELDTIAGSSLGKIDLFFTVPDLKLSVSNSYLSDTTSTFLSDLQGYAVAIDSLFEDWRSTTGYIDLESCPFRIGGFHIPKESSEGDTTSIASRYFSTIKQVADEYSWNVMGIPYTRTCSDGELLKSRYRDTDVEEGDISSLVSIINQQPNAFPVKRSSHNDQIIDQENLAYADQLMQNESYGAHIEHHTKEVQIGSQPYRRVIDYLDYGKRLGYVNYRKSYIDDEGDFFNLAFSEDEAERFAYDELYRCIMLAEKGHVLNSRFEHVEVQDSVQILSDWKYASSGLDIPSSDCHDHNINLSSPTGNMHLGHLAIKLNDQADISNKERVPVDSSSNYEIAADVNSDCNITIEIQQFYRNNDTLALLPSVISVSLTPTLSGWNNVVSSHVVLDSLTTSIELTLKNNSCDSLALLDNLTLEKVSSSQVTLLNVWSQAPPMRVNTTHPAYLVTEKNLIENEPLRIQYSARFRNEETVLSSSQTYELGVQFYDSLGATITGLTGDSLKNIYCLEQHYNLLPATGVSRDVNFLFDSLTNSYNYNFDLTCYGKRYTCLDGGTPCEYLGCGTVNEDLNPSDPMDTWYTSQTVFTSVEIPEVSFPLGAESYRVFYMNTSGDNSELIVHRPWMNELALYEVDTTQMNSPLFKDDLEDIIEDIQNRATNQQDDEDLFIEHKNIKLKVYPNPTSGKMYIELLGRFKPDSPITFMIVNSMGKTVWTEQIVYTESAISLNVGSWKSGIYTAVVFEADQFISSEKFEIVH